MTFINISMSLPLQGMNDCSMESPGEVEGGSAPDAWTLPWE